MVKYAILLQSGHNRVYYEASQKLAVSELTVAANSMHSACRDIQIETIAGTPYCTFQTENEIDTHDLGILSRLSFVFVLFRISTNDDQTCLTPVLLAEWQYINEKITTLLKYKGKTNELFTKMMVNIAYLTSALKMPAKLLDPMAGKGTTLHAAMAAGLHAYGIEVSKTAAHDACVFIKKFLETERLKHTTTRRTINGDKKAVGKATAFTYAADKQAFASGDTRSVEMVAGDAAQADCFYKKAFFDMVVADLPYGVQHGSRQQGGLSRSPEALLQSCLPTWTAVLKKGGAIVLSWNTYVLGKNKMTELLAAHGFLPMHEDISFSHSVDVSIQRDIVIAVK